MTTLRAFKGAHSFEVQIGKRVFQVRHRGATAPIWCGVIRRVNTFTDPFGRWV